MTKFLYSQKTEINKIPKIKIVKIKKRGILKTELKKIPPTNERQKYKNIFGAVIFSYLTRQTSKKGTMAL